MNDFTIIAFAVLLYFLPWIVAAHRFHPNRNAIAVLNAFAGWTLLAWVVAMVWALTSPRPPAEIHYMGDHRPQHRPPRPIPRRW